MKAIYFWMVPLQLAEELVVVFELLMTNECGKQCLSRQNSWPTSWMYFYKNDAHLLVLIADMGNTIVVSQIRTGLDICHRNEMKILAIEK